MTTPTFPTHFFRGARVSAFALALSLLGGLAGLPTSEAAAQACAEPSELVRDLPRTGRWIMVRSQDAGHLQFLRTVRAGCPALSLMITDGRNAAVYDLQESVDGSLIAWLEGGYLRLVPVSIGGASFQLESWILGADAPISSDLMVNELR